MSLRIVGAGLGRTGTMSLKLALERLLGGPCYHMTEVFSRPDHVASWHDAARGRATDWPALFDGHRGVVDWPACAFWREISAAFPDALILLSTRDAEAWWKSASETIFPAIASQRGTPWHAMVEDLFASTFTGALADRAACIAAYERHNAAVRREAPAGRLVEWSPGDGWEPLCRALGVPIPHEAFPHVNSTEDFRRMHGTH